MVKTDLHAGVFKYFWFCKTHTQCPIHFTASLAVLEGKSAGWSGFYFILFKIYYYFILFCKMDAALQTDLHSHSKTGYSAHFLSVKHCQFFLLFYARKFLIIPNHLLGDT